MKAMLLASVISVSMVGYGHGRTLEEVGQQACAADQSSPNCALYEKQKAKAEQRGRDAELLRSYVVRYEPVTDIEWHVVNQAVTGWTVGQAPIFTYNEDGYRMGIAGHDYFNQRVAIAEGALLDIKPGTFDPGRVETTVGFFHGPAGVTMPTAAIEPTPLVCEAGDSESRKLMGDVVLRCHWPNQNEWFGNEAKVREAAISKAEKDARHLQVDIGPPPNVPREMHYAPTKQMITLPQGSGPRPRHGDINAILHPDRR